MLTNIENSKRIAGDTRTGNRLLDAGKRDLAWLDRAHAEQLALCRELEEIADSLPASINRQKCIYAAKALGLSRGALYRRMERHGL